MGDILIGKGRWKKIAREKGKVQAQDHTALENITGLKCKRKIAFEEDEGTGVNKRRCEHNTKNKAKACENPKLELPETWDPRYVRALHETKEDVSTIPRTKLRLVRIPSWNCRGHGTPGQLERCTKWCDDGILESSSYRRQNQKQGAWRESKTKLALQTVL